MPQDHRDTTETVLFLGDIELEPGNFEEALRQYNSIKHVFVKESPNDPAKFRFLVGNIKSMTALGRLEASGKELLSLELLSSLDGDKLESVGELCELFLGQAKESSDNELGRQIQEIQLRLQAREESSLRK